MNNNKLRRPDIGFYIFVAVILIAVIYLLSGNNTPQPQEIQFSEMVRQFKKENVEYFDVEGETVIMQLREPYGDDKAETVIHKLLSVNLFYSELGELVDQQLDAGILKDYDYKQPWNPWWLSFVPYLAVLVVMAIFWFVMFRSATGGGRDGGGLGVGRFGKAQAHNADDNSKKKTFADVAGADEEKAELEEIVDFLRDPKKYAAIGARIPKGVLLVGPPGTGKTLLAKAVAGEANVQFLSISGSDFVELYVGVGASRVRDLFDQAKKLSPAIIFIDEIDAVGRQRGSGLGGGHDEREQTLNQLLVEMDGFNDNEGVIVMAATNRADILDSALLRPGRFDRQIYVGMPDVKGREEILKIHSRGKSLGDDIDLKSIAMGTSGFTGADLENLMNESALLAARRNKPFITMAEIDDAILKVEMGPEKKSHVVSEKERRLTAYHEAGHAIAGKFLENVDPVHYITIIPRRGAGGFTLYRPDEDTNFYSRSYLFERIVVALGGRTAEKLFINDISTGASGDIQSATQIARQMVTVYGMSEKLGPISFDESSHSVFIGRDFGQTKSYSEETAAIIDEEVKRIFDEASDRCEALLKEHSDLLIATAEYLLKYESMTGEVFNYLCEHGELPPDHETNKIMDEIKAEAVERAKEEERTELMGEYSAEEIKAASESAPEAETKEDHQE